MVNVGGRSKGCSTCRRRRVKCDETRPVCRRCQRCNFECDGPRGAVFIQAVNGATSGFSAKQQKSSATRPMLQPALSVIGPDVYICYTRENLQKGGLIVSAISDIKSLDILPAETTLANGHVSHQALLSFATILFGLQHRRTDIARHGYAMFSVALTQLNQALANTTRHTNDEVIMAVATLAISEILVPSGKNNYIQHIMGLQRLLGLQTPSIFWPHKPYGFRNGVRFMMLLSSLQVKSPCILARAEWKRAMRVNCSPKELQEQDLYDVVADCTVLLAKSERISAAWDVDVGRATQWAREVEDRGQALLAQLCAWRRRWHVDAMSVESKSSPPACDSMPSLSAETEGLSPSAMVELMLFDVALACVLQIMVSLPCQQVPEQPISLVEATAPAVFSSPREYYASQERLATLEASRFVRSFLGTGRALDPSVPPVVHWAIGVAWRRLRHDESAEGTWLREILTGKGRQVIANGLWTHYKWVNSLPE